MIDVIYISEAWSDLPGASVLTGMDSMSPQVFGKSSTSELSMSSMLQVGLTMMVEDSSPEPMRRSSYGSTVTVKFSVMMSG